MNAPRHLRIAPAKPWLNHYARTNSRDRMKSAKIVTDVFLDGLTSKHPIPDWAGVFSNPQNVKMELTGFQGRRLARGFGGPGMSRSTARARGRRPLGPPGPGTRA